MPRSVADTDDEAEILFDDGPSQLSSRMSQHSTFSWVEGIANDTLRLDGAADRDLKSTSSSQLRRQVAEAERGLLATHSDQSKRAAAMQSSTSPVHVPHKEKRRRETFFGSESAASPGKGLKRVKTYGSQRTVMGENGSIVRPSLSPGKTMDSSGGLPAGTIRNDFIEHDPNVMFRDTGTTNAYGESSQEQLVEQARGNFVVRIDALNVLKTNDSQKSETSSFPWPASVNHTQQSEFAKKYSPEQHSQEKFDPPAQNDQPGEAEDQALDGRDENAIKIPTMQRRPTIEPLSPVANNTKTSLATNDSPAKGHVEDALSTQTVAVPPNSSPLVLIDHTGKDTTSTSIMDETTAAQMSGRGRKRKSQDIAQPLAKTDDKLDSDDEALMEIGLQKEQYKPRPSRRRATQIETPTNYSITVEKAVKRRKTAGVSTKAPQAKHSLESASPVAARDALYECLFGCGEKAPEAAMSQHLDQCKNRAKASQISQPSRANEQTSISQSAETSVHLSAQPSPAKESPSRPVPAGIREEGPLSKISDHTSSAQNPDAGLMPPPTIPPSTSKRLRRSKTTIFEDHVEFGGLQKSPSLSQQQAKRKAALLDVKNNSTQRQRRKVVQDEDDEEDELAKNEETIAEESVLKKRRGRPPKVPSAKSTESASKVVLDSEDEEVEEEEGGVGQEPIHTNSRALSKRPQQESDAGKEEVEERPQKRSAERAVKSKSRKSAMRDSDDDQDEDVVDDKPSKRKGRGRPPSRKSKEKVLSDSDADEAERVDLPESDDEPSKKKRPGKSAKSKPQDQADKTDSINLEQTKIDIASSDMSEVNKESSPTKVALQHKNQNQQSAAPPTPPPEKVKPTLKPSPTTHSPIKSIAKSEFPVYRVGLSKTKRIPSLLKSFRPPKPDTRR